MMDKIKAPEKLKRETIALLEERKNARSIRKIPVLALAAAAVMVLSFTALGMDIFSGLRGDELSLSAEYKDHGTVDVKIKNLSQKELKLSNNVKLMRWKDSLEIGTYIAEIPAIGSDEEISVNISIPDYKEKKLLEPLESGDHYYFVFTNNNFLHGYDYMASFNFTEPEDQPKAEQAVPKKEITVREQAEDQKILEIKKNLKTAAPLKSMEVTVPYGSNERGDKFSDSVSFKCREGEKVRAILDGEIIETGKSEGLGIYVVIAHENGLKSQYSHLSEIVMEKGRKVSAGEVIGKAGKTGKATGNFLKLMTSLDGKIFDPMLILK